MSQRSRDIQIKFRVSEEEAEQLRKKVEQSGKSMQEYLLSCALNKPITNTDGIKELPQPFIFHLEQLLISRLPCHV